MIRLRTFGGLGIERDGAPCSELAIPRKSLALLALVAVQGVVSRDRLMALLWPESSAERARGSLKQAMHLLRRQVGVADLFLGASELRLHADRIESDVGIFLRALASGEPGAAVEVYQGPFLEGVHFDESREFERWVETEREVLARRHREALGAIARAATAAGDLSGAVEWWRRLQASDPLNTAGALELIDALERAGDRAGALRHARVHELLLQEELGLSPDPQVARRVARLRDVERGIGVEGSAASTPGTIPPPVAPAHAVDGSDLSGTDPGVRATASSAPVRWRPLAAAGVLAALLLVFWLARGAGPASDRIGTLMTTTERVSDRASVAVLPFVDMSPDGSLVHWADGVAEEILNTLAGIPEIRVPARTSSFHFRGRNVPVREIAEILAVDHVLEGSVRVAGDRLRITAQLVDARDDRHLWSATFDSQYADVFAVQEEIARTVAEALRVAFDIGGTATAAFTPDPDAHEVYLRGLFHWHRRSRPDLLLAIRHFEEATRLDPAYAKPWAGLALVYASLPPAFASPVPLPVARVSLEESARRALALDTTLAEVHAALGFGYQFDWRWEDAEREFVRALELNPRSPTAHQWYAAHQARTFRADEARNSIMRALELDPLSLVIRSDVGLIHLLNRDHPAARTALLATVREDPSFAIPYFLLHRLDMMEGDLAGAEEWGRRWAALAGSTSVEDITLLTRAAGDRALRPAALRLLDAWESGPGARWHDLAFYRIQLGDRDGAIRVLSRGVEERAPMMVQLVNFAWFDPLREDPEFQALLGRVAPWAIDEASRARTEMERSSAGS
jgi:adenylate cyclase